MTSVEELGDFKAAVPGMVVNERTRTALAHKTLLAVPGAYTTTVRQLVGWETGGACSATCISKQRLCQAAASLV